MSGKVQIISAILKLDRPFRPPHIIDMTGLPRELVYYHLKTMTNDGWLTKTGRVYECADKEELLNSLVEIAERVDTRRMESTGTWFSSDGAKTLNSVAESIVCSMALGDKVVAPQLRDLAVERIDKTVHELKQLRKFLHNSQRTEQSAANKIGKMLDDVWDLWLQTFGVTPSIGKKEWRNGIEERIEEL